MTKVSTAIAAVMMCCYSVAALSHVTVWPRQPAAGTHEKYVVRVPTEGKVATSSIELQIPDDLVIVSMGKPNGYTYELKRTGERVSSIVWTVQIPPGEFVEFSLMARNPKVGTQLVWKAVQFFNDGSKTAWIGARSDEHPASVTLLTAAPAHHAH